MPKPLDKNDIIERLNKHNHQYLSHEKVNGATKVTYLCGNCGNKVTIRPSAVNSDRCSNCRRINREWNRTFTYPSQTYARPQQTK